jgi:hypothetical protein
MKRILLSSLAVILFAAPAFARADGDQAAKPSDSGSATAATAPASSTTKKTPAAESSSVSPATASTTSATTAAADTTAAPVQQQKPESSSANPAPPAQTSTAKLSTSPDDTADGAATFSHSDAQMDQGDQSPLFFKIGGAEFSPLGFMDFTTVFRSTDVGSGIGTSFGGIPFNAASPAGQLSEVRFSAQNSRVGMKIDADPGGDFKVRGYLEADFLGNAAANVEIGSHSYTLRMRLYWVDVHRGKVEILAGQSWSMMTPNRVGISPMPGDVFYSQDMDTNYQVGLVWLRDPGFRLVFHPTDNVAWGFALEDPEQYTGGLVTFPTGFSTAQVDDSGGNSKTPNKAPDIISKLAFDTHPNGGGRNFHVEVAGVYRAFRLNTVGLGNVTTSGGGGSINANLELAKGFHLIANTFWSDGGGRYIFQLGPDFAVNVNGAGNFIPSPIHAGSGVGGFEYTVKKSLLYAYYGAAYFGRDSMATTGTGGTTTYTGYGYPGSPNSQNRTIQEPTIGLIQTFWKNPNYGDLKLITQVSYLSRNPWADAATSATGSNPGGAPSAHLGMAYVDLRYDLP